MSKCLIRLVSMLFVTVLMIGNRGIDSVNAVGAEEDALLQEYVENNILDGYIPVECSDDGKPVQIINGEQKSLGEKLQADILCFENADKGSVYTVVSFCFPAEVKISKRDSVKITAGEKLRPVSPADFSLFTKKGNEWVERCQGEAMVSGNWVDIYGEQMVCEDKVRRVIVSFYSNINPEVGDVPYDCSVEYMHYKNNWKAVTIVCTLALVIVILGVIKLKNQAYHDKID